MIPLLETRDGFLFGPLFRPADGRRWSIIDWSPWNEMGVRFGRMASRGVYRSGNEYVWLWGSTEAGGEIHVAVLDSHPRVVRRERIRISPDLIESLPIPSVVGGGRILVGDTWIEGRRMRKADHGILISLTAVGKWWFGHMSFGIERRPPWPLGRSDIILPDFRVVDERGYPTGLLPRNEIYRFIREEHRVPDSRSYDIVPLGWGRDRDELWCLYVGEDRNGTHAVAILSTLVRNDYRFRAEPPDSCFGMPVRLISHSSDGGWLCAFSEPSGEWLRLAYFSPRHHRSPSWVRIRETSREVAASLQFSRGGLMFWASFGHDADLPSGRSWVWRAIFLDHRVRREDHRGIPAADHETEVLLTGVPVSIRDVDAWEILPGSGGPAAVFMNSFNRVGEFVVHPDPSSGIVAVRPGRFLRTLAGFRALPDGWSSERVGEQWRFWRFGDVWGVIGHDRSPSSFRRNPVILKIGYRNGVPAVLGWSRIPAHLFRTDLELLDGGNTMLVSAPGERPVAVWLSNPLGP